METEVDLGLLKRAVGLFKEADGAMEGARRQVGLFVFDEFFGGDEKSVKSRYPWKPMTYAAMKKQAAAETSLGEQGRIVVRYSGTEPKVRVMVEARNKSAVRSALRPVLAALRDEAQK